MLLALCAVALSACGSSQPAAPAANVTSSSTPGAAPNSSTTSARPEAATPGESAARRRRPDASRTRPGATPAARSTTSASTAATSTVAARDPSTATTVAAATPRRPVNAKIDRTASAGGPKSCLKTAGLGHIRSVGRHRWQGTTGDNGPRDTNGSVFADGPYASVGAADRAAETDRLVEIAFPGGRYVVTASKPSYLSATVSLAAACLSAGFGRTYGF